MPTRFYLPSTGTPNTTPAFGAWGQTTSADRVEALTARINSAMSNIIIAKTATGAGTNALFRQYVSKPISAQTLPAGTIKGTLRCAESAANDNIDQLMLLIRVVSNDGNTYRTPAVLALGAYGPINEWTAYPTLTARRLADGDATTEVVAQADDRIVIEIGFQNTTSGVSITGYGNFGDNSATDLGDNETDTAANNPFLEFSFVITFATKQALLTEAIAQSDGLMKRPSKLLADTLGFADALMKRGSKLISDAVALADVVAASRVITKALAEALSSIDGFLKRPSKLISEAVSISESLLKRASKILSDAVASTDVVTQFLTHNKLMTEALSFSDALLKRATKALGQTLAVTDVLMKRLSKFMAEALNTGVMLATSVIQLVGPVAKTFLIRLYTVAIQDRHYDLTLNNRAKSLTVQSAYFLLTLPTRQKELAVI